MLTGLAAAVPASAASSLLGDPFADAMRGGAAWVMTATLSWWINVPSIDLATSPAHVIRGYVLWVAAVVATAGVMWQSILLVLSRRPDPLLSIGRGLFSLALWAGVGIAGPALALRAGDAFSSWVLDQAAGGHAAARLVALAGLNGVDSTGAVIVLGLLLMLAGLVQAVIMIFREGAVVVLAGVVVLAASGSMTNATRTWLPRVLGWMVALIAYKPIAALVYATALTLIGNGQDPRTILVGLTMMLLAIVALPALMRFFSWTTSGIGSSGGGSALLGVAASGASTALALHAMRGSSAAGQASRLRSDLASPPPGATPSPTPPSGPGPVGPPQGTSRAAVTMTGSGAGAGATSSARAGAAGASAGAGAAGAGSAAGAALPGVGVALVAGQVVVSGVRGAAQAGSDALTGEAQP